MKKWSSIFFLQLLLLVLLFNSGCDIVDDVVIVNNITGTWAITITWTSGFSGSSNYFYSFTGDSINGTCVNVNDTKYTGTYTVTDNTVVVFYVSWTDPDWPNYIYQHDYNGSFTSLTRMTGTISYSGGMLASGTWVAVKTT